MTPEARAYLAESGYDPDFGARPLKTHHSAAKFKTRWRSKCFRVNSTKAIRFWWITSQRDCLSRPSPAVKLSKLSAVQKSPRKLRGLFYSQRNSGGRFATPANKSVSTCRWQADRRAYKFLWPLPAGATAPATRPKGLRRPGWRGIWRPRRGYRQLRHNESPRWLENRHWQSPPIDILVAPN